MPFKSCTQCQAVLLLLLLLRAPIGSQQGSQCTAAYTLCTTCRHGTEEQEGDSVTPPAVKAHMASEPGHPLAEVPLHKRLGVVNVGRRLRSSPLMLAHLRGEYLQDHVNRLSVASHSIRCGHVCTRSKTVLQSRFWSGKSMHVPMEPPQEWNAISGLLLMPVTRRCNFKSTLGCRAGARLGRERCCRRCTMARASQSRRPPNWVQAPCASWRKAQRWFSTQSPSTFSPQLCSFATHLRRRGRIFHLETNPIAGTLDITE